MSVKISEKTIVSTLEKLDKLKLDERLHAELSWCWNSYKFDNNPVGVIEKSKEALALFKAKREENSRAVAKKLVDDLEKIVLN
ncbi:hypothetical protein [Cecembia lonarensis]|uniref:Uncharacterized protein n=1 Tax=Cecembia lonarensis (strain CCUG 58316 / KCTC 22772 / LW9) TaxID=1225176 RepID=K1LK21_CECL9|nr:hypothetical protein [Cecembia lonarensis]EKB50678.1 hypothetical protein B879_00658 [Cecembia lonarensis LW9]